MTEQATACSGRERPTALYLICDLPLRGKGRERPAAAGDGLQR